MLGGSPKEEKKKGSQGFVRRDRSHGGNSRGGEPRKSAGVLATKGRTDETGNTSNFGNQSYIRREKKHSIAS